MQAEKSVAPVPKLKKNVVDQAPRAWSGSEQPQADQAEHDQQGERGEDAFFERGDGQGHGRKMDPARCSGVDAVRAPWRRVGESHNPSGWVLAKNCASKGSVAISFHGRLLDTR